MTRFRTLRLTTCLLCAACGGSSETPVAPSPVSTPTPAPTPTPLTGGMVGTVLDVISDAGAAGLTVRVDGLAEVTTDAFGRFVVDSSVPAAREVTLTSATTIERRSQLLVPGPAVTLSVIPTSFDLASFDQMFRGSGGLRRWKVAPRLVLQRRVLEYTTTGGDFVALADVLTDAEASDILTHLRWALPLLTGNTFTAFAEEIQETAAHGERVLMSRVGAIVVAETVGLTEATTFWGIGRSASDARGTIVGGSMMLDRGFETSPSQFRRSLRAHELGHSLGYGHVTNRASVMNSNARLEPVTFDTQATRIAFRREPGSRSPDTDPGGFTANAAAREPIRWTAWVP